MFSKAIPRKPIGLRFARTRICVGKRRFCFTDMGESETKMVNVKLRRNPTVINSATYNEDFVSWSGQTVIVYCKTGTIPVMDICLNISNLLSGTSLSNWRNVLEQLPDGHVWNVIIAAQLQIRNKN
jgi:hypothetical protein